MRLALALCLAVLHAAPGRGRARRPLPALDDGSQERDDRTILANRELTELLLPLLNNFESPRHAQRDLLHQKRLVEIMPLPQKNKQRKGPAPLFLLASELPVRTKTKLRRYSPKDSDDFDENMVELDRSHHKKKKKHHKHKHHHKHHHKNSTSEEDSALEERKHKNKKHKNHGKSGTPVEEHSDSDEQKHRKKKQKEHDDSNSSSEEHSDSDEDNKDKKQHDSDSESSSEETSDSDEHVEGDESIAKEPIEDKNISNETKNYEDKNDDKTPSENKDFVKDKKDDSKNKHAESALPEVGKQEESLKEKKDSVENKHNIDTDQSVSPKPSSEEHKTPEFNRYGDMIDFSPDKQAHGQTSDSELADIVIEERTSQSDDSSQQDSEIRYRNLPDGGEPDKSLESVNEAPQDNELLEIHYHNTIGNEAVNDNDDSSNSNDATRIAMNEEFENTVLDDDVLTEVMENQENPDVSSWLNAKETVRFISSSSEEDLKVISNHVYSTDNVSLNEEESNSVEFAIHDSLSPATGLDDIEPEESQESDSFSSEYVSEGNSEFISSNLQPLWDVPVEQSPPPDSVDSFIEVLDDGDGDGAKHDAVPGQNYGYVYRNANKGDVSESHKTYKLSFRFNK